MARNAAMGVVGFLAGLVTAWVLFHSAPTLPEEPGERVSVRFDALDEALARLDQRLRGEASRPGVGPLGPLRGEPAGNALEQDIGLVREELHRILEALEAHREALLAAEGREDPPRSAANHEAQQRSWAVLNDALAAQRWTDEDARDLLASWGELSPAQREEILATLLSAANRGEIELESASWLF